MKPDAHDTAGVGEQPARGWRVVALVVLAVQIMLGGWVSANYAAVACPDFPTCQRSFWPDMDFKDAFVLWRGLGIDYEGGVLDNPARVAIHVMHRLGAVDHGARARLLGMARRAHRPVAWRTLARHRRGRVLATQLVLGPFMVLRRRSRWRSRPPTTRWRRCCCCPCVAMRAIPVAGATRPVALR